MSKTAFTRYTVEIKGLDNLLNWLKHADPKLEKAMRAGIKDAMQPVLEKARANAKRIHGDPPRDVDDVVFGESLGIASRKSGTQYVLKSTDPVAGVKEFARRGAVGRTGKWRGKAVGVPHRANKPRVMVSAVEDSAEEVKRRVDERMAEVLKEVERG